MSKGLTYDCDASRTRNEVKQARVSHLVDAIPARTALPLRCNTLGNRDRPGRSFRPLAAKPSATPLSNPPDYLLTNGAHFLAPRREIFFLTLINRDQL